MKKQPTKKSTSKPAKKASAQWTSVSRLLRDTEPAEMIDLLRQLYMLSPDNAKFIDSKFILGEEDKFLEECRHKIKLEFFPKKAPYGPPPRMGWMKALIRDYKKGTGDMAGTAELMVTFQEQGMEYTMAYGDIDERFYDSLLSGMNDVIKMLTKDAPQLFPAFRDRLVAIVRRVYGRVGWGYGDGMYETVAEICEFHGRTLQRSGDWRSGYKIEVVEK